MQGLCPPLMTQPPPSSTWSRWPGPDPARTRLLPPSLPAPHVLPYRPSTKASARVHAAACRSAAPCNCTPALITYACILRQHGGRTSPRPTPPPQLPLTPLPIARFPRFVTSPSRSWCGSTMRCTPHITLVACAH